MASVPTRSSEDRDSSSDNFADDDLQVLIKYLRVEVESHTNSSDSIHVLEGGPQSAYLLCFIDPQYCNLYMRDKQRRKDEEAHFRKPLFSLHHIESHSRLHRVVDLRLRSQYDSLVHVIHAVEIPLICNDVMQVPLNHEFLKEIEDKGCPIADKLLSPEMTTVPGISFLLGADHLWKFMPGEIRHIDFVSHGSSFGWMFQGPLSFSTTVNIATQVSVLRVNSSNKTTDTVLRKFSELEAIGIMTEDDNVPKLSASVLEGFQREVILLTTARHARIVNHGSAAFRPVCSSNDTAAQLALFIRWRAHS
ncbi:hypothetical protein HPB50_008116 [Hyalomma asiaticum]|uniref:Uncharacterized protein n=1 Tax=Hyalomma asiaticum TaxID=266040 RepID=A0ACB7S600_HYAAI|nr:hypothetical protein HPB50_008116 [Hyalomma asiaticum]